MADGEWNEVVARLQAVEDAILTQSQRVGRLSTLLADEEAPGEPRAAATPAAAPQPPGEHLGVPSGAPDGLLGGSMGKSGSSPAAALGPAAADVEDEVDRILSSALSELGLEAAGRPGTGGGGADKDELVSFSGSEMEARLAEWVQRHGTGSFAPGRRGSRSSSAAEVDEGEERRWKINDRR